MGVSEGCGASGACASAAFLEKRVFGVPADAPRDQPPRLPGVLDAGAGVPDVVDADRGQGGGVAVEDVVSAALVYRRSRAG